MEDKAFEMVPVRVAPAMRARLELFAIEQGLSGPDEAAAVVIQAAARGEALPARPVLRRSEGAN